MVKNKDKIKKAYDLAFKHEAEIGSCPQCVLSALKETLDLEDVEGCIKASDSLAGGTCLSSNGTCGALVGGMLALGSLYGRSYESFSKGERRRRVFQFSKKLYDRFIDEYGSILCKDVQKKFFGKSYNLLDKDEYKEFEKNGAHVDKCPSVAGNVASWTAEIILNK